MNWLRVFLGVIAAGLFLLIFGPPRLFARSRGWDAGRTLPVAFHRLLCAALRLRVRQFGAPSAVQIRLVVANHVSWLDIPALGSREPMSFLAKKEVGYSPLGRYVVALQGGVYVDRQRKRAVPEVNSAMAEAMRRGEAVVLFAEATTGDGNRLLRFRSSHFEAIRQACAGAEGIAAVQPLLVRYCGIGGLPVARVDRPLFAWYGDTDFFPHLWRVISAGGVDCEIHYGDAIPVGPHANRKQLARETERSVKRLVEFARSNDRERDCEGRSGQVAPPQ